MNIQVRQFYAYPHEVCVVVDGECNHADMHYEIEHEDYTDETGRVIEWRHQLYVCNKCEAYCDAILADAEGEFDWHEVWA